MSSRIRAFLKAHEQSIRTAIRRASFCPFLELLEARLAVGVGLRRCAAAVPDALGRGRGRTCGNRPDARCTTRDTEADGVHSAGANGDDTTGIDDEDGVTFGGIRTGALGATATVTICCGPAKLDAWIDFNGDGSWGGPGEQIADTVSVDPGDNVISFDVPSWALDGTTIARFRLSTAGNLGVGGVARRRRSGGSCRYHHAAEGGLRLLRQSERRDLFRSRSRAAFMRRTWTATATPTSFPHPLLTTRLLGTRTIGNQSFIPHTINAAANGATACLRPTWTATATRMSSPRPTMTTISPGTKTTATKTSPPTPSTPPRFEAHSVFATDVDGDGDMDVVVRVHFR